MLTVQYLEGGRDWTEVDPAAVRGRLRDAFGRLPIDAVAVGWGVPPRLVAACAAEARRAGAALYRWHVLLAGDGTFAPRPECRVVGLASAPVPAHGGSDDFTFVCPNRTRPAVLEHLETVAGEGPWDGLMLDRMRFPSPAADPATHLGCFCDACHAAAAAQGIDLAALRADLPTHLATPAGRRAVAALLGAPDTSDTSGTAPWAARTRGSDLVSDTPDTSDTFPGVRHFLAFRARAITSLIADAADLLRARGLRLGLDCFSPSLAPMVGQDLAALGRLADWVKVMTYGHALGPAGIPFELAAMAEWLVATGSADEPAAVALLTDATGLPLPPTIAALRRDGIPPAGLAIEAARARAATPTTTLAGIELVDVPGLCELRDPQIRDDLAAFEASGLDGLALSWELWRTPPERLDLVAEQL